MREILKNANSIEKKIRITPACAGNTCNWINNTRGVRDHPRMCGKYFSFPLYAHIITGSPPHVREILYKIKAVLKANGITPACAGNTTDCGRNSRWQWDHPRMCGKYNLFNIFPFVVAGSPPHVREILREN